MFKIIKKSKKSNARVGVLKTAHGDIQTPVFMPVGTLATVKGMTVDNLNALGAQIILANTYHLSLRPTTEKLEQYGGIHSFMNWKKPILTDSGGYQVFSLSKTRKIYSDRVEFRSHLDGSLKVFTPKNVIDHQRRIGSDIWMPLDICTPYPASKDDVRKDMMVTNNWIKNAHDYWAQLDTNSLFFTIIQGGMYPDLRKECVSEFRDMGFSGFALGGVSVGEPREEMEEIVSSVTPELPEDKPRYLMGVGLPENMDFCIRQGIDMFDCVAPARLARHGHVFTKNGKINLKNKQFQDDLTPIDDCDCITCQSYSKAYLRHLLVCKEMLAPILLSYHNIHFLVRMVDNIRNDILAEV